MVAVLTASLHKQPQELTGLGAVQESTRLRLALQASGCAIFDWDVAAGTIVWDGALDILPFRDRGRAQAFVDCIAPDKRGALEIILDTSSPQPSAFTLDVEIASAMGAV